MFADAKETLRHPVIPDLLLVRCLLLLSILRSLLGRSQTKNMFLSVKPRDPELTLCKAETLSAALHMTQHSAYLWLLCWPDHLHSPARSVSTTSVSGAHLLSAPQKHVVCAITRRYWLPVKQHLKWTIRGGRRWASSGVEWVLTSQIVFSHHLCRSHLVFGVQKTMWVMIPTSYTLTGKELCKHSVDCAVCAPSL